MSSNNDEIGELHKIVGKLYKDHDDEDLPALGQFYCVECGKYFVDENSLKSHQKSKVHRRRVKMLMTEAPYTQADAEAAVGFTTA